MPFDEKTTTRTIMTKHYDRRAARPLATGVMGPPTTTRRRACEHHHGVRWGNPRLFLFFVPGKLMAALAYRDDKILARNLLSRPFFCLTPAEPFFRPDRSSPATSCRVAVKDGRAFRGHPKGLSLTAASTMARWRYRSGRRPCVAAEQVSSPRRSSRFRFPFPQCLQKCGNSNREVHRLSRFSDHQSACSCSIGKPGTPSAWLFT